MGTTHFRSLLRYADPRTNARAGTVPRMAGLAPYLDFLSDYQVYANNFIKSTDYDATNEWTLTSIGSTGTAVLSDDLFPSHLIITNTAANDDSVEIQFTDSDSAGECWSVVAAKKLYFETRIRMRDTNNDVATVVQRDVFVGLAITDTTVEAGATDFIGFSKKDGTGLINVVAGKNASGSGELQDGLVLSTGRTLAAADANVWVKLGFLCVGGSAIYAFVDNVHVATSAVVTNHPDDEMLCVTVTNRNGEGVIKILDVDYLLVAQER